MEITIAKNSGFCPGVRRAADAVENAIKDQSHKDIFVLGELIHNNTYNKHLSDCGVITVSYGELEDIARKTENGKEAILFIRAHGVTEECERKLASLKEKYPRFDFCDMTCRYVKRIHTIAKENTDENTFFALCGSPSHPEVEGIIGHSKGEHKVFSCAEDAKNYVIEAKNTEKELIFASQTTHNLEEMKKTKKILEKVYTNSKIFDTICVITENRQKETELLAKNSDAMIIIGSKHSSNTKKLYEIAGTYCQNTRLAESASELDMHDFCNITRIGIAAGASTPDSIIEEVLNQMNEYNGENFAELLEESLRPLNTGDVVKCIVTSVSAGELGVDLGAKVTGVIPRDQVTDDPSVKLEESYKVGDEFEAFVIKVSDIEGMATLSKKRVDLMKNWNLIVEAHNTDAIVEGEIIEAVRGGVIMLIKGVKVFVPGRLTGLSRDKDLSTLIGTQAKAKIVDVNETRRHAYASIRAVADEERREREAAIWNSIEEGQKFTGKVKSLTSFGAFVDIGGVDGMVHNSELSWKRISNPAQVVSVGQEIEVYVKSFDPEKRRISLGYKTEEMNGWYQFKNKYNEGDVASVKIVSLLPFGAFAEIVDGVDGLIHISQIARKKIGAPSEVLNVGDIVDAKITAIDDEKQKVSLSIRALLAPEAKEEAVAEEAAAEEEAAE